MKPLPNVYAVYRIGNRWLAIAPSPQTLGRTFERRELVPSERLHVGAEGGEPGVQDNFPSRPRRRAIRAAK